jgi:hypothetical protein
VGLGLAARAQLGGIAEVTSTCVRLMRVSSAIDRDVRERPAVDLVVRALGAQIFLIDHAFSDV